jgi:hypothetical protein
MLHQFGDYINTSDSQSIQLSPSLMELMHNAFPLSVSNAPDRRHEWEVEIVDMVGNLIQQQMGMLEGEEKRMKEGETQRNFMYVI